ncbi:AIM24 family protein [Clostridium sp. UBA4548]|uniref:AIM24 family protein n=1 Tax=Clostridium sp. UBA4548 TaxID=1946361 RepID=UPI0025BCCA12|nr:AIM24 family protein [Clostridium sp. UBA4548]
MITYKNLYDNKNIEIIASKGDVKVLEYKRDLSVDYSNAVSAYFASEMKVRKRQVLIELKGNAYTISAGAMQWTSGSVTMVADVKGIGDFLGKALSSKVTKESAIKPRYQGNGLLMLEPTYKHILLEEVSNWGGLVLDDGLFLACESKVQQKVVARTNLSSAMLGNEGLFNLCLRGEGVAILESPVPREELIEFELQNDEVRIDGNYAIAWSDTLEFRVEKSGKSLVGSAVSGEGLVNVYRGTGRILMAPIK